MLYGEKNKSPKTGAKLLASLILAFMVIFMICLLFCESVQNPLSSARENGHKRFFQQTDTCNSVCLPLCGGIKIMKNSIENSYSVFKNTTYEHLFFIWGWGWGVKCLQLTFKMNFIVCRSECFINVMSGFTVLLICKTKFHSR